MVKADPGLDACCHDGVDEAVIKFQPLRVRFTATLRQDPRPGGRQAIRADPEFAHQRDVFRPATVMVAGDVAGILTETIAWQMAEGVPDRRSAPVFLDGAFDLVRGGRGTPEKPIGKACRHYALLE